MTEPAVTFGGHSYTYKSISSSEVEIYDNGKVVAKVDSFKEAREWIDEEYDEWSKKNKDTEG